MTSSISLRSGLTVALGRAARVAARLHGGGSGGTAFPGLVMEKADPGFLARALGQLPMGIVVVTGTNGKTTTTKMVVQLLAEQGLRVVTNRTGSNFVRGVLASLLHDVDAAGRLRADVAVLELDEAHAVRFVQLVKPRACLLLNVMRDQLDRFGEIDYTASLLRKVALATTGAVVTNADDPRLGAPAFTEGLAAPVTAFGAGGELRSLFLSDDELRTGTADTTAARHVSPRVVLESLSGQDATVSVDGVPHEVRFAIPGIHNQLNACAALAVALQALGDRADAALPGLLDTLGRVRAAFGRGEVLRLDGREVQLSLVKNPAGFRMGLLTAATAPGPESVMVAINDEYADGRDMSWLWDVDFSGLRGEGVAVVTGVRAWDMALRLRYDEVDVGAVEPDLAGALDALREDSRRTGRPMRVFTTYTAMLALRARLGELTEVEEVMK